MAYFWKKNLPVVLASAVVLAACMGLALLLPVTSWLLFLAWGVVYTVLFAAAMWLFVLDSSEKSSIAAKLPFLR